MTGVRALVRMHKEDSLFRSAMALMTTIQDELTARRIRGESADRLTLSSRNRTLLYFIVSINEEQPGPLMWAGLLLLLDPEMQENEWRID
jgi:hypothetical protein